MDMELKPFQFSLCRDIEFEFEIIPESIRNLGSARLNTILKKTISENSSKESYRLLCHFLIPYVIGAFLKFQIINLLS